MDVFPNCKRREIMSRVKNRNTLPEVLVRSLLHRLGYRFRLHDRRLPGTPDIVLPRHRVAIFVNGCFWHGHDCPRGKLPATNTQFWAKKISTNTERDSASYDALLKTGWSPLVVWACQTTSIAKLTGLGHRLSQEITALSAAPPPPRRPAPGP
ncbi:MAG: DNA mismatch endonuclease Vsr, partial [Spirochaetaceae bacterium]